MAVLQWAGVVILGLVSLVVVTDLAQWTASKLVRPHAPA
jgi:hypothetical protein